MNSEAEITRLAKENETFQKSSRHSNIRSIFSLIILFPVRKKKSQKRIKLSLKLFWHKKELLTGIGPVTSALPMRRSTD